MDHNSENPSTANSTPGMTLRTNSDAGRKFGFIKKIND